MAEKYVAYAKYKKTDSEWVSEIPTHWESILFKRVITQIKDGTHGTHARVSEGFAFLSAKNVLHKGIEISDSESMISEKDYKEITANGFPKKGDLLITCVGTIGRTCVYEFDKPYAFQRSVAFLRLSELALPKFYKYFVESKAYQSQLEANSKASAQSGVYMGDLVSTSTVLLPKGEQEDIAKFLDHETTQIDTLIDKQQTLIQLLKEKRQAVISHAVTKGLNPDTPMKDSGVEWLGDVPEHWEVKKLKYVCDLISQKTEIYHKDVIALENIESWTGNFVPSDSSYSGQDVGFDTGDILFSKLRPYLAKVYLAKTEGVALGDLLVYRPKKELLNKYGFYLMTNKGFINTINSSAYGSKMPRASTEFISEMPVVIPLIQEQKQIVDYVDKILARFDSLVLKAEVAIQLMQERRTALISAAVTGKIDVRGWQAPAVGAL